MFEGKNYAKESSAADKKAFDQLLTGEWDQNNLYVVMFVCKFFHITASLQVARTVSYVPLLGFSG